MTARSLKLIDKVFRYVMIVLAVFTLIVSFPVSTIAADPVVPATPHLSYLVYQSTDDQKFLIGETKSIKLRLYDQNSDGYSGSVTAYISDPKGKVTYYTASGSSGNYSINNVTLDYEGDHSLVLYDKDNNYASGTINVIKPQVTITGDIIKNRKTYVTGVLKDSSGNIYSKKSVTVDGTDAGLTSTQNYTTDVDGKFSFTITPTEMGQVKFLLGGYEIGTVDVKPAYSHQGRIGGTAQNNKELSIQIAQAGWTKASTVILTRDDNLADSLTAVPLSKKFDAPILMNPTDRLDTQVLDQISYLGATYVFIIGGEGAVSKNVENQLINWGYVVERIAGADRYETSAKIASKFSSSGTVYLAYGEGEPDALAASSFAAIDSIPILLTDKDKIPEVTLNELARLGAYQVKLLGGEGVIDPKVQAELEKKYLVERWGGKDRFETEWTILRKLFTNESKLYFSSAQVSPRDVTSGQPFGDALLAAALAAKNDAVVINIPQNYLPKALDYFLLYNRGYISEARVIGNTSAIGTLLERQLEQLLTR